MSTADNALEIDEVPPPERLWLLWARKWSILAVVGSITGLTLLHFSSQPKVYASSAEVLVRPNPKTPGALSDAFQPTPNMEPARRIATSEPVRYRARENLPSVRDLPAISVTAPEDSYTLVFRASSTNRYLAQETVAAYVNAYVAVQYEQVLADLLAAREPVERRLAQVTREADDVYRDLLAAPEPDRESLQARYNLLLGQRQSLQQERDALRPPTNGQVAQVLKSADVPEDPAGPQLAKFLALGLFLGGTLGVGQALIRSLIRPRVQGTTDLAAAANAPVLAVVPRSRRWRPGKARAPVTSSAPDSKAADAYHLLAATLLRAVRQHHLRTVLVTSPNQRDGRLATAANLAVALAGSGQPTVLFGLRWGTDSSLSYFPPLPNEEESLSVNGSAARGLVMRPIRWVDGLTFVRLENGSAVMRGGVWEGALRHVLSLMEEQIGRGVLVIDAASVFPASNATLAMAAMVDAVLLTASADRTSRARVHQASESLERVGSGVFGAVLTDVRGTRAWFERRFVAKHGYSGFAGEDSVAKRSDTDRFARETSPRA